ncbi:hypothetical protein DICPUDRAFT_152924 [Dictyostelium purpureum]|uniref:UBX domain-containing protein n=1 Tax=Dictyostelium purpureum TaxID=5786 RepID=F0ZML9_DICPU|nr:uncharacterized protein DICPUDRAFT_152924 [Dictyostelium purpureum]EGC34815.1 hypothetical protein DICPUDRAFT_152924 [Dictyostelium purpureum]|eukprot:XP_003288672.1 hypothetical protein DICPUDRAFT_152924 [Dictyostelium purpureum]
MLSETLVILWVVFLFCCVITFIYEYFIPRAEKKKWDDKKPIEKDPNEIKKIITSKQEAFDSLAKENEIRKRKKKMEEVIRKHLENNPNNNKDLGIRLSSIEPTRENIESETQRIIREQDLEYLESLELDKMIEKEKELKKQREEQTKKERRDRIDNLRNNLKEEPANGIKILIKLPSGMSVQRKFLISEKIQDIVDYIDSKDELKVSYYLSTNYPKAVYKDLNQTLEESNITSPTTLYITEK